MAEVMNLRPAPHEIPTVLVGKEVYYLPYADLLPPLGNTELEALRSDIARRRCVLVAVVIDDARNVIDGANRVRIAAELGITEVPVEIRAGLTEAEKRELAEDLNLHRRHLTRQQIRDFIATRLARAPEQSNNAVATRLGVDDKTVASVRRQLETTSEIPKLDKTIGADGKARMARRPTVVRGVGLAQAGQLADQLSEIEAAAIADPSRHAGLLDVVNRTGRVRAAHRKLTVSRRAIAIANEPPPLPDGPFRVIVVDPPWRYALRADDTSHRSAPYPDMSVEEICDVAIPALAHDDAILWLWVTNAHMRDAYAVLDAWGFDAKTILTWAKDRIGLGDWLRGQTEHCIMAVRGQPIVTLTNQSTLLRAPVREHSPVSRKSSSGLAEAYALRLWVDTLELLLPVKSEWDG